MPKIDFDSLWSEIISIKNIEERRTKIIEDIKSSNHKYCVLAKEDPYRLFMLLGGDESEITTQNWAFEFNYEDYLEESGGEFSEEESKKWDLEERSIQRALDLGYWYVTGESIIMAQNGDNLVFEFQYSEGYLDGIIGTPYNQSSHGNHGIPF